MNSVITRAGDLLGDGKAGEAVRLLEAERAHGASPTLFTLLGYALYQDSRIAEARDALADGVARFPFDARLQEAWARIRWMAGEGDAFADGFIAAVAEQPRDGVLRVRCADLLRLAGRTGTAEELLRAGLALDPEDVALGVTLSVLLDEMGRLEEALAGRRDAVQRSPGEPMLRLNLAHTLLRLGRADAAMLEIAPIRRAFPAMQLALTYEGMALKQLGNARYSRLFDYERFIHVIDIGPPSGFPDVAQFNAALGDHLRRRINAAVHPLEQPLRGGTQTSQNLVDDDAEILRAYFSALVDPVRAYIAQLGGDKDHPLEGQKAGGFSFSGCWSELLRPGGFHVNHARPGGWIAGFYDVALPPGAGGAGEEGLIRFGEPPWPVPGCGVERVVQPKEGRLVLFPSYMWHGTGPVISGERLTAPLDVVPA